jgi:hypothetical protein
MLTHRIPTRALVLAIASLGILSACGGGSGDSQAYNGPPLQGVLTVQPTDMGPLPQNPDIWGRDEAYSVSFQGYSIWLYGDTFFQNQDVSGRTALSNTWSYTSDFDASIGITGFQERLDSVGSPSWLIQETPDEHSFNLAHGGDGNSCQVQPCARLKECSSGVS